MCTLSLFRFCSGTSWSELPYSAIYRQSLVLQHGECLHFREPSPPSSLHTDHVFRISFAGHTKAIELMESNANIALLNSTHLKYLSLFEALTQLCGRAIFSLISCNRGFNHPNRNTFLNAVTLHLYLQYLRCADTRKCIHSPRCVWKTNVTCKDFD